MFLFFFFQLPCNWTNQDLMNAVLEHPLIIQSEAFKPYGVKLTVFDRIQTKGMTGKTFALCEGNVEEFMRGWKENMNMGGNDDFIKAGRHLWNVYNILMQQATTGFVFFFY